MARGGEQEDEEQQGKNAKEWRGDEPVNPATLKESSSVFSVVGS